MFFMSYDPKNFVGHVLGFFRTMLRTCRHRKPHDGLNNTDGGCQAGHDAHLMATSATPDMRHVFPTKGPKTMRCSSCPRTPSAARRVQPCGFQIERFQTDVS